MSTRRAQGSASHLASLWAMPATTFMLVCCAQGQALGRNLGFLTTAAGNDDHAAMRRVRVGFSACSMMLPAMTTTRWGGSSTRSSRRRRVTVPYCGKLPMEASASLDGGGARFVRIRLHGPRRRIRLRRPVIGESSSPWPRNLRVESWDGNLSFNDMPAGGAATTALGSALMMIISTYGGTIMAAWTQSRSL